MREACGAVYVGKWQEGKKHGWGTKTYNVGAVYSGEWKADMKHGPIERRAQRTSACVVCVLSGRAPDTRHARRRALCQRCVTAATRCDGIAPSQEGAAPTAAVFCGRLQVMGR